MRTILFMAQLHFLSFGGPSETYHNALNRLRCQAIEMNVFSTITALTESDIQSDTGFWTKHGDFILSNPRGYGYWIWKSYLIQKTLSKIPDGDILLYLDAGCELNPYAKSRFFELVHKTLSKKIIGTHAVSTDITYSKMDTIEMLGLTGKTELLRKNHMQAGYLMMVKCPEIVDLVDTWFGFVEKYHLVDDSPSVLPNAPEFIEHRHDQSILNLLVKKNGLINYDAEPADCKLANPVWYCRNRDGPTIINERPY